MGINLNHLVNSGCFGCCTKPTPVIAVDEPSKGLKIQGRSVKKPTISDDFWSSSTCDLDNSTAISQRSISSISTSNQTINHGGGTSSSHPEFIYTGKLQVFSCGIRPGFSGLEVAGPGVKQNKVENAD
ncbi:hypothetical protein TIFTF001_027304 [Ficus carica]|uniref:Uncharacterized protein n=1 Tax=Ficus carica TaxID=3494 RepID=A0AA88J036_FICCA|nr:hypothetical protein TIFTF001_027304 [Ficus carica]